MAKQFETLTAAELHCPRCKELRPVRERLLLVVPGGEIHAYRCATCGDTLGTREVRATRDVVVPRSR
jgi:phage FluMu protein Com